MDNYDYRLHVGYIEFRPSGSLVLSFLIHSSSFLRRFSSVGSFRARARVFLEVLNIGKASGFSLLADPTPLVAVALSTASAA